MADFDLLVVGGGISGLSLGHLAARRGKSVVVLEKAGGAGGCVASSAAPDGPQPFWIELGAHTLYNSYQNLIGLIEACGLQDRVVPRRKVGFRLLVNGELKSIPSQLDIPELLLNAPRLFFTSRKGRSIHGYYSRIVGPRNFERVFKAMFDAVACQDTADFGVDFLFKKRPGRRKDFRRSFTLDGGLATLIAGLARTPGLEVRTGSAALSVSRSGGRYSVALADGTAVSAEFLALATPPADAASLLEGCFPDIARLLAEIKVNRLYSLGVSLSRDAVALPEIAGIVSPGDSFYSVVSRDVVPHPSCRGFTFHFREDDRDRNLQRTEQVLGARAERFDRVEHRVNEIPRLGVGHADLVRRIDGLASGRSLLLAGNYFLGLSLEDCVSRSAGEAGKLSGPSIKK